MGKSHQNNNKTQEQFKTKKKKEEKEKKKEKGCTYFKSEKKQHTFVYMYSYIRLISYTRRY